jgi:hypothetical protein
VSLSPQGIVDWSRTAFRSNPGASDDEIVAILRDVGLPQAGKAVVMLVLAYGRSVLAELVDLPSTFTDGDVERLLFDDPVYVAAHHLAQNDASREDVEGIGLHSSEVGAVNQALNAGHEAKNLILSPPSLLFVADRAPDLPDPQEVLDAVVRAHGSGVASPLEFALSRWSKAESGLSSTSP